MKGNNRNLLHCIKKPFNIKETGEEEKLFDGLVLNQSYVNLQSSEELLNVWSQILKGSNCALYLNEAPDLLKPQKKSCINLFRKIILMKLYFMAKIQGGKESIVH